MKQYLIRDLTTLKDFADCVEVQKQVWGFDDPFDVVPLPMLMVSERNDGIVMGAYDGERMIGFVYSLPGAHKGKRLQWSHMLAVLEQYRDSDIGYQLKMAQYKQSQEKGYEFIEWTYDPLESRNAYFNLRKLGCIAHEYEVNVYGETSSPLHMGMPTDRFIAHWKIPPMQKQLPDLKQLPQEPALITRSKRDGEFLILDGIDLNANGDWLYVEIPTNMQSLKSHSKDAALNWRLKTREIFLHYLSHGYIVYSFLHWTETQPARSFYIMKKDSV